VRRFFALLAASLVMLAGAITAQAATSHPAPRQASRHAAAAPASEYAVSAQLVAAKKAAAKAFLIRTEQIHAAHAAHAAHRAHLTHLHLLHVRQLAVWAARAEAHAAAVAAAQAAAGPVVHHSTAPVTRTVSAATAPVHAAAASYTGSGSMQQCIISRESGGNSQVMNSTGHYGLYQFSESTWEAYGGSAASFGNASVAEQNQVFATAVARNGYSDWTPYDGC
jgi:transglycosylase-like protein